MSDESRKLPRISVTRVFCVDCSVCGQVEELATQVEAKAVAVEHGLRHREGTL